MDSQIDQDTMDAVSSRRGSPGADSSFSPTASRSPSPRGICRSSPLSLALQPPPPLCLTSGIHHGSLGPCPPCPPSHTLIQANRTPPPYLQSFHHGGGNNNDRGGGGCGSPPHSKKPPTGLTCVVCGDTSSGKHYGILACNGCSGFFKRSVRRRLIYRCQAGTGRCVVDKAHRNQCQACRLKKCLEMGMNKDDVRDSGLELFMAASASTPGRLAVSAAATAARKLHSRRRFFAAVQNERQPRNTATIRPEALIEMEQGRALREAAVAVGVFGPPASLAMGLSPARYSAAAAAAAAAAGMLNSAPSPAAASAAEVSKHENDDEDSIDVTNEESTPVPLLAPTPRSLAPCPASVPPPAPTASLATLPQPPALPLYAPPAAHETVYETAARLLFMAVKWAKNLPSFASLPFRDQVILLEESWSELFLLNAIQWCLPLEQSALFSVSEHAQAAPNGKASHVAADIRVLNDCLARYKSLAVDPAEFACLKAIVLFRSETRGLKDPSQVENLQDQAQVMLGQHVRAQHPTQPARFGRLLLMLPLLRLVATARVENIFFHRTIGSTPMEKVLCDMYKN